MHQFSIQEKLIIDHYSNHINEIFCFIEINRNSLGTKFHIVYKLIFFFFSFLLRLGKILRMYHLYVIKYFPLLLYEICGANLLPEKVKCLQKNKNYIIIKSLHSSQYKYYTLRILDVVIINHNRNKFEYMI